MGDSRGASLPAISQLFIWPNNIAVLQDLHAVELEESSVTEDHLSYSESGIGELKSLGSAKQRARRTAYYAE
jgi:hypothetical protein